MSSIDVSLRRMLRQRVYQACKQRGLTLQRAAFKAIQSVLAAEEDVEQAIEVLLEGIQAHLERHGGSSVVTEDAVGTVVADLSKNDEDVKQQSIQVISAYAWPKYNYDATRKKFFKDASTSRPLHGAAAAKIAMFRERLALVHQRLMRHKAFAPRRFNTARKGRQTIKLTPVDALVTKTGRVYVLAMLTQREEGRYYLEDLSGGVEMDVSRVKADLGIVTENSIVMAQGEMRGKVFVPELVGFPPGEARMDSLLAMDVVDPFEIVTNAQALRNMQSMAKAATDVTFITVSDVHLDSTTTMEELRRLFSGFAGASPSSLVIILIGNFTSRPFGQAADDRVAFTRHMQELADLIGSFPDLANEAQFVLVPGPDDPGSSGALPRPPVPSVFTQALRETVRNITMTTNPCRMRFFTHEVVISRSNIASKLLRHTLVPPSDDHDIGDHVAYTLIDQGHLSPLPLSVQPIHWEHDHALRLYPLPDVLILADEQAGYTVEGGVREVTVFNPGPFAMNGGFTVLFPSAMEVQMSSTRVTAAEAAAALETADAAGVGGEDAVGAGRNVSASIDRESASGGEDERKGDSEHGSPPRGGEGASDAEVEADAEVGADADAADGDVDMGGGEEAGTQEAQAPSAEYTDHYDDW